MEIPPDAGHMSKDELIQYLIIYQKAAKQHAADAARVLDLQKQLRALDQGQPMRKKKRGRPPKHPGRPPKIDRAELEENLRIAQAHLDSSWTLYRQLDEMRILSSYSARRANAIQQLLESGQADSLDAALKMLE